MIYVETQTTTEETTNYSFDEATLLELAGVELAEGDTVVHLTGGHPHSLELAKIGHVVKTLQVTKSVVTNTSNVPVEAPAE